MHRLESCLLTNLHLSYCFYLGHISGHSQNLVSKIIFSVNNLGLYKIHKYDKRTEQVPISFLFRLDGKVNLTCIRYLLYLFERNDKSIPILQNLLTNTTLLKNRKWKGTFFCWIGANIRYRGYLNYPHFYNNLLFAF